MSSENDEMNVSLRFAQWVARSFRSKTEAAGYFGMELANFRKYLTGERRITDSMKMKSMEKGIDLVWLNAGTIADTPVLRESTDQFSSILDRTDFTATVARIPFYPQKVNAGVGVPLETPTSFEKYVDRALISDAKSAFCVYCLGESMTKVGIMDDSFLICRRVYGTLKDHIGKVVIATVDGVTYVKRLLFDSDKSKYHLRSEGTKSYKDIVLDDHASGMVIGVVTSIHTDLEKHFR